MASYELILNSNLIQLLQLPVLGRLVLASILGGAIGFEREVSGKEAGLRTNLLICIGASLLAVLSIRIGTYHLEVGSITADTSRIMAAVISGIGFLGAGTIIQAEGSVTGLTTAATLWVVAAIGIATGVGAFVIASGTTLFVLAALIPLGWLEQKFFILSHYRIIATIGNDLGRLVDLTSRLKNHGFEVLETKVSRVEDNLYEVRLEVSGGDRDYLDELPKLSAEDPDFKDISSVPLNSV